MVAREDYDSQLTVRKWSAEVKWHASVMWSQLVLAANNSSVCRQITITSLTHIIRHKLTADAAHLALTCCRRQEQQSEFQRSHSDHQLVPSPPPRLSESPQHCNRHQSLSLTTHYSTDNVQLVNKHSTLYYISGNRPTKSDMVITYK